MREILRVGTVALRLVGVRDVEYQRILRLWKYRVPMVCLQAEREHGCRSMLLLLWLRWGHRIDEVEEAYQREEYRRHRGNDHRV